SELHGVDGEPDVPIGLLGAVGEDLEVLHLGLDAYLGEGVEEARLLPALRLDDVGDGADEDAVPDRLLEDVREIDAGLIKVLRAVIEVLGVDEDAHALGTML